MAAGRELLLDTCAYIDVLQGRSPPEFDLLLQTRIVNHSTIVLSELAYPLGALDPATPGTTTALRTFAETIDDIPPHRLTAPSTPAYAEVGMLAGLVARLTGQTHGLALLNDALLFLQAVESGCDLLTRNVRDFDWFDQLLLGTGVLLYR
jgi:predicted nucleic acid-binding protein